MWAQADSEKMALLRARLEWSSQRSAPTLGELVGTLASDTSGGGRALLVRSMHGVPALCQASSAGLIVRSLLLPEAIGKEQEAVEEGALGLDALLSCAACATELPSTLPPLTGGGDYNDTEARGAEKCLLDVGKKAPRAVCQYVFKRNDIVWICRTCQADETCVMCNACFRDSTHEGHDVYFYHAQAGGCCDCGDADAWQPGGFCSKHGEKNFQVRELAPCSSGGLVASTKVVVEEIARALLYSCASSVGGYSFSSEEEQDESTEAARDTARVLLERCGQIGLLLSGEEDKMEIDSDDVVSLVLHNDDVHTLNEMAASLQVLGMSARDSRTTATEARERGEALLRRGSRGEIRQLAVTLKGRGVLVSMATSESLVWARRTRAALRWLHRVAASSDAMCRVVCGVLDSETLAVLLRADARLPKLTAIALHTLYLALMADPMFKRAMSRAYARVYRKTTADYARGVGVAEHSLYTLSVQFLNRATFVTELVESHGLLRTLAFALLDALDSAAGSSTSEFDKITPRSSDDEEEEHHRDESRWLAERRGACVDGSADTAHAVLFHRRYSPIIADLKCVLNIEGMSPRFLDSCLLSWLASLGRLQGVDAQRRRSRGESHVVYESKDWIFAFNVNISVASAADFMASWVRRAPLLEPRTRKSGTVCAGLDLVERVCRETLKAIVGRKQSIIAEGSTFHVPLHRFLSLVVLEATKTSGLEPMLRRFVSEGGLTSAAMEDPLRALAMAAEVRVGLWRRNGHAMKDQLMNYAEPPFCKMFRDLDIGLLQLVGLAIGASDLTQLLLEALDKTGPLLARISSEGDEERAGFAGPLAEEALHLITILATELPRKPVEDRVESLLRRELVHRLAAGACTHSEVHDCFQLVAKSDTLPAAALDTILNKVSTRSTTTAAAAAAAAAAAVSQQATPEPDKWRLKPECWREYDASFYHLSPVQHQKAMDTMPTEWKEQSSECGNCPEPPEAHLLFASLRNDILSCDVTLFAVHATLLDAANNKKKFATETAVARTTHLLALIVRCCDADKCLLFASSSNESIASLVCRLADHGHLDSTTMASLAWLAKRARPLLPQEEEAQSPKKKKSMTLDDRKRRARERAMAAMKVKSEAFASQLTEEEPQDVTAMEVVDDDKLREDYESVLEPFASSPTTARSTPEEKRRRRRKSSIEEEECEACIVCREPPSRERLLGLVGFAQRSTVLRGHKKKHFEAPVHVRQCGHALHYDCFDAYLATVVHRSEARGHVALDIDAGEFQCPLCKRLSNILLPREEEEQEEDYFEAVETPQTARFYDDGQTLPNYEAAFYRDTTPLELQRQPSTVEELASFSGSIGFDTVYEDDSLAAAVAALRFVSGVGEVARRRPPKATAVVTNEEEGLFGTVMMTEEEDFDFEATEVDEEEEEQNTAMLLPYSSGDKRKSVTRQAWDIDATACSLSCCVASVAAEYMERGSTHMESKRELRRASRLASALRRAATTSEPRKTLLSLLRKQILDMKNAPEEEEEDHASSMSSKLMALDDYYEAAASTTTTTTAAVPEEEEGPEAAAVRRREDHPGSSSSSSLNDEGPRRERTTGRRRLVMNLRRPLMEADCLSVLAALLATMPAEKHLMCLRLLALARAAQCVYARRGFPQKKPREDSESEEEEEEEEFEFDASSPPREEVRDLARLLGMTERWSLAELASVARAVDTGLLDFLRRATLLLEAFSTKKQSIAFSQPLGAWMAHLGVASLKETLRSPTLASTVEHWGTTQAARRRTYEVSAPAPRTSLWKLPRSYTELHAALALRLSKAAVAKRRRASERKAGEQQQPQETTALFRNASSQGELLGETLSNNASDHPAVCLVCGAVLCADGKGACTRHAASCGAGVGVVFLLEESSLLLLHGPRAAYFPSPYVDAHGERHGQFRGRPLFLDDRRLEVVRKLWATHAIADTVVQARSTSRQVIINNFY